MPIHNQRRLKAVKRRLTIQAKPLEAVTCEGAAGPVAREYPELWF